MTDTEMLITALRQCADKLAYAGQCLGGALQLNAKDAVRDYRNLADDCEGRLTKAVDNE